MTKSTWFVLSAVALVAMMGCVPAPDRQPTEVKNAGDIVISVGQVKETPQPELEEPVSVSSNSTTTPTASQNTTAAITDSSATAAESKPIPAAQSTSSADVVSGPAVFRGRVTVKGMPAKLLPLVAQGSPQKDQICSEKEVPDQKYVISDAGGLANVFVYLKKAPKSGVPKASQDPVVFDQQGCKFLPHAVVLQTGQPLELKNSDPISHNVRITGLAVQYNNTIPGNSSVSHTFDSAERLPINAVCDFHKWMSAYVLPIDHPWATITDSEGRFEIPNLPDGELEFIVWHEAMGYVERSVKFTAKENSAPIEINFEVEAAKLSQ